MSLFRFLVEIVNSDEMDEMNVNTQRPAMPNIEVSQLAVVEAHLRDPQIYWKRRIEKVSATQHCLLQARRVRNTHIAHTHDDLYHIILATEAGARGSRKAWSGRGAA